jgi:hypothetical protein
MRTDDIVVIVSKRLFDRFTDCLESRKMYDCLALVTSKGSFYRDLIPNVAFNDCKPSPGDLLNPAQRLRMTVAEVVEHYHCVTSGKQFDACVRTDVTRTASDEDAHKSTSKRKDNATGARLKYLPSTPEKLAVERFTTCVAIPFLGWFINPSPTVKSPPAKKLRTLF